MHRLRLNNSHKINLTCSDFLIFDLVPVMLMLHYGHVPKRYFLIFFFCWNWMHITCIVFNTHWQQLKNITHDLLRWDCTCVCTKCELTCRSYRASQSVGGRGERGNLWLIQDTWRREGGGVASLPEWCTFTRAWGHFTTNQVFWKNHMLPRNYFYVPNKQ